MKVGRWEGWERRGQPCSPVRQEVVACAAEVRGRGGAGMMGGKGLGGKRAAHAGCRCAQLLFFCDAGTYIDVVQLAVACFMTGIPAPPTPLPCALQ